MGETPGAGRGKRRLCSALVELQTKGDKAGTARWFFGIPEGMAEAGRGRWDWRSRDTELCLGASKSHTWGESS